jgi:hypothetical protein
MQSFLNKVRGVVRENGNAKQESLIRVLNPILRGWANYHRHISASASYRKAEMVLWQSLRRWARRRHPMKSAVWIANRCWHQLGKGSRTFAVLEVCLLSQRSDVSTPVHSITERHSLFPASSTRCPISVPCGNACPEGRSNGLTLFRLNDTIDLVPASYTGSLYVRVPQDRGGATGCTPFG